MKNRHKPKDRVVKKLELYLKKIEQDGNKSRTKSEH